METMPPIWAFLLTVAVIAILWIVLQNAIEHITTAITNHRKKKYSQLFSYINFYNGLADSCNEIFKKEYLPNLKKIDYFYNNVKYFPQDGIKSRQFELEHQKQSLEDAKKDMEKVWNNAQEYYELIKEYSKTHKILWVEKYLDGFPPF